MSLSNGNYQVISAVKSSAGKPLRIARYYDNLLLVNDSSGQTVKVTHISGDTYRLQFVERPDDYIGPTDNISSDNSVLSRPGQFEWSINQAGGDNYKIHVPNQDYYWSIPDNAGNETKIRLVGAQGKNGELWSFEKK